MHRLFDWLMLGFVVAIVFLLVRPRSQGPTLVEKAGNAIIGIFSATTGGGGW